MLSFRTNVRNLSFPAFHLSLHCIPDYHPYMLKLCVICHHIGQPYDPQNVRNEFTYGIVLAIFVEDLDANLCPQCKNRNCMIPIDSTRAQKIIEMFEIEIPEEEIKPPRMPWQY